MKGVLRRTGGEGDWAPRRSTTIACHIPVEWEHPTEGDFEAFETAVQQHTPGKTLIHCAANFRVTAFYSLYATKHLGWSQARADEFRASIWEGSDYPVWERFIEQMKD